MLRYSPSVLNDAKSRIEQVRKKDVVFLVRENGAPVENAHVSVRMKNHAFLFGAVCYAHGTYATAEQEQRFTELFTKLFNYTMVPFHWKWYEPVRGQYNEPYTGNLVRWAQQNRLKKKLHALIWHELCPDWVTDETVQDEYVRRISHLMETYGGDFDFFDLANETTVNDRFDNPVSRWVKRIGPIEMMRFGTKLVRAYRPDAKLLFGDWNVHKEEYFHFLGKLRDENVDIDLIGMQSHMQRDLWTAEETMRVIERAASYGFPIHFPECSICSGTPIGELVYDSNGTVNRFFENEEWAQWQADFASDFYTLVFSEPAVEALSWFDFTDHRWLGAPGGVIDDGMNPKPVYHALYDLIHRQWHTDADLVTASEGSARARLFCGDYEITVKTGDRSYSFVRTIPREHFYAGGGSAVCSLDLSEPAAGGGSAAKQRAATIYHLRTARISCNVKPAMIQ